MNIVDFPTKQADPEPHPVVQVVVAQLEDMLAKAKSGELRGFVCAVQFASGTSGYAWLGELNRGTIGALEAAKFNILLRNEAD